MSDWRPIETAPKETDSHILLAYRGMHSWKVTEAWRQGQAWRCGNGQIIDVESGDLLGWMAVPKWHVS